METKAKIIFTDGRVVNTRPANGKDFSLEEMQDIVGGSIDIQQLPKSEQVIVLNDNGKLEGKEVNELATKVWKENYPISEYPFNNDELIVGTVLICDSSLVK